MFTRNVTYTETTRTGRELADLVRRNQGRDVDDLIAEIKQLDGPTVRALLAAAVVVLDERRVFGR